MRSTLVTMVLSAIVCISILIPTASALQECVQVNNWHDLKLNNQPAHLDIDSAIDLDHIGGSYYQFVVGKEGRPKHNVGDLSGNTGKGLYLQNQADIKGDFVYTLQWIRYPGRNKPKKGRWTFVPLTDGQACQITDWDLKGNKLYKVTLHKLLPGAA